MRRRVPIAVAIAVTSLLVAQGVGATISASFIQSPTNETAFDPDLEVPTLLQVVGTAGIDGNVDIRCTRNNGQAQSNGVLGPGALNVPLIPNVNTFNTGINLLGISYERCRLLAVPSGFNPPYNPNAFGGPIVSVAGHRRYTFPPGINAGALYDYYQVQSALEGYWAVYAAGDDMLSSSYPIDPDTLDYKSSLWSTRIRQQTSESTSTLQIAGRSAVLPGEADNVTLDVPGFQPITNLSQSIDQDAGGVMHVSESEPLMFCDPSPTTCAALTDAGVRLDQTAVSRDLGHTLEIRQRYVNTTGADLAMDITYAVELGPTTPGWLIPGDGDWKTHAADDTVVAALDGPGSLFARFRATEACSTIATACGSLTWYRAPDAVRWESNTEAWLTYHVTIPANGSSTLAFNYSQGFPQSQVDGFATAAEQAYQTAFTIGAVTQNKKKGTATIAVDVPAAGRVHAEGQDLTPVDLEAAAAGTVSVPVEVTGKTKKKLKRKGKVDVQVVLSFSRAGLDPASQTTTVTVKRKRR